MQLVHFAGLSTVAAVSLAAAPAPARRASTLAPPTDSALAARIEGTWAGHRTSSLSQTPEPVKLTWRAASAGDVEGRMSVRQQPAFPVKVVWSSDTAFIFESAAHESKALDEQVVTRSVVHFKGDSLTGTFDARPTTYKGKTLTGSFSVGRTSPGRPDQA
jgi:hypothetical protein